MSSFSHNEQPSHFVGGVNSNNNTMRSNSTNPPPFPQFNNTLAVGSSSNYNVSQELITSQSNKSAEQTQDGLDLDLSKELHFDGEQNYQQDESDNTPQLRNPVVFQCHTCRTILGDSHSYVAYQEDLELVCLSSAFNVSVGEQAPVVVSTKGIDHGSSYVVFCCDQCNSNLGRIYKSTTTALDSFRDLFCFSRHKITSYELGTQLQRDGKSSKFPTYQTLLNEVKKLQFLISDHSEKLDHIENVQIPEIQQCSKDNSTLLREMREMQKNIKEWSTRMQKLESKQEEHGQLLLLKMEKPDEDHTVVSVAPPTSVSSKRSSLPGGTLTNAQSSSSTSSSNHTSRSRKRTSTESMSADLSNSEERPKTRRSAQSNSTSKNKRPRNS